MTNDRVPPPAPPDDPPPILGTWRALYTLTLGTLALIVIVLALLTSAYR